MDRMGMGHADENQALNWLKGDMGQFCEAGDNIDYGKSVI